MNGDCCWRSWRWSHKANMRLWPYNGLQSMTKGVGMLEFGKFSGLSDDIDGIHFSRKPRTCGLREMRTVSDVARFVNARVAEVGANRVPDDLRPTLEAMRGGRPVSLDKAMKTLDALDLHGSALPTEYLAVRS